MFCPPTFQGYKYLLFLFFAYQIITVLAHLLKCILIHIGSNVLNQSFTTCTRQTLSSKDKWKNGFPRKFDKRGGHFPRLEFRTPFVPGSTIHVNVNVNIEFIQRSIMKHVYCDTAVSTRAFLVCSSAQKCSSKEICAVLLSKMCS